ncbi:MAG: Signal transduction histidine-protein kinase/phosphatase DegS [Pelotomaculum sp. PtaB.Bin104]|nr:MAG: Signal transduction histidine-protein kinase/phosphatase DegS [Pelotomaculum sp. PtaB.Bin104]
MVIIINTASSDLNPELLMVCKIDSPFIDFKKTRSALKKDLSFSVDSFEFAHAGLVLLVNNKQIINLHVSKKSPGDEQESSSLNYDRYLDKFRLDNNSTELMETLKPSAMTTIPLILRACDPVSKMEIGVFNASTETGQNFLNKATSLGIHIVNIIQESVFGQQKDRNLRKLSVLLETVCTISSTLNPNQILHVVSQLTADLFNARCAIFLFKETDQTIIPAVGVGSFDKDLKKKFRAQKGLTPYPAFIRAMKEKQPVILTPDDTESSFPPEIMRNFSYAWVLLIPLLSNSGILGIMQVDRPIETNGFSQEDVAIFSAIAKETSIAMENTRLIVTLEKKEKLLQQLFEKLICAQEDERKRVASEIHDGVIQALLGIWYRVQRLATTNSSDGTSDGELIKIQELLGQQIQEIRRIVYNLRPVVLDQYGLGPALRALIGTLQEDSDINFELIQKGSDQALPANFELTIYRVIQELLTNALKHSQATRIQVILNNNEKNIEFIVKDNGTGFNPAFYNRDNPFGNLGLANIHERIVLLGGTCKIDSQLGWGTTVTVQVPNPHAN